jgi:hypothetical protein
MYGDFFGIWFQVSYPLKIYDLGNSWVIFSIPDHDPGNP